jgi:hypothetical protein
MSTTPAHNPIPNDWPVIRQAAQLLCDDLHNLYPTHGEAYFAELQGLVNRLVRQSAPTTGTEFQARLTTLGEITLAAYRVRERIELGTVM